MYYPDMYLGLRNMRRPPARIGCFPIGIKNTAPPVYKFRGLPIVRAV
jgi:hypothetical protein